MHTMRNKIHQKDVLNTDLSYIEPSAIFAGDARGASATTAHCTRAL